MTATSRLLLLDTNIVVFLSRGGTIGEAIDRRFTLRARPERPLIAAVTVGEALAFAHFRSWGQPRIRALSGLLRE